MTNAKHWSGLSYLDALRPEPGWKVDRAVLTTYSADLVAIGAALLALSGVEDDGRPGSRVDFARAADQLGQHVRVLVQAGRLAAPRRPMPIFVVFDRFVREVPLDERRHSWHPKVALVRLCEREGGAGVRWRLWIGSRNLTRDISWDAGLLLVSDGVGGDHLKGIDTLGAELVRRAIMPDWNPAETARELARARWRGPAGVTVEEVLWLPNDGNHRLPAEPTGLKRLTVVSPFLDPEIVGKLGAWRAPERLLVTCGAELARLAHGPHRACLDGFARELLTLEQPAEEAVQPASDVPPGALPVGMEGELDSRGLHAKLILAEHQSGHTLWLGSANATSRGWNGGNCEVVVRLKINEAVADGIAALVNLAQPTRMEQIPSPSADNEAEETLERTRKRLAVGWALRQERATPEGTTLIADQPPPLPDKVALSVAAMGGGDFIPWPDGGMRVPLTAAGAESELVRLRLRCGELECAWLQAARLNPAPLPERDHRAIASFLDARTFLGWIRALLADDAPGDAGGAWNEEPASQSAKGGSSPRSAVWAPTLEDALKAWRPGERQRLIDVDTQLRHYLRFIRQRAAAPSDAAEQKALDDFDRIWTVIRESLLP